MNSRRGDICAYKGTKHWLFNHVARSLLLEVLPSPGHSPMSWQNLFMIVKPVLYALTLVEIGTILLLSSLPCPKTGWTRQKTLFSAKTKRFAISAGIFPKQRANNRPGHPRRPNRAYLVPTRTLGISPDCGAVARRGGYAGWGTILAPTLIVPTSNSTRPRENSRRPPETRFTSVSRLIVR